jgi:hypothetical protein
MLGMFPQDFLEFFESLEKHRCEYLVVGGYAMGSWGYIRATGDLDIFVNPTQENAGRVFNALESFGAPLKDVSPDDFFHPGTIYQMGVPPIRIDILTQIDGLTFSEANQEKKIVSLFGYKVPVLSLNHLILNKRSTGRDKDLIDAAELEKLKKTR